MSCVYEHKLRHPLILIIYLLDESICNCTQTIDKTRFFLKQMQMRSSFIHSKQHEK